MILPVTKYKDPDIGLERPAIICDNNLSGLEALISYFYTLGFELLSNKLLNAFSFEDNTKAYRVILINRNYNECLEMILVEGEGCLGDICLKTLVVGIIYAIDSNGRNIYELDPFKIFPQYFYEYGDYIINLIKRNKEREKTYLNLLYI